MSYQSRHPERLEEKSRAIKVGRSIRDRVRSKTRLNNKKHTKARLKDENSNTN